jgi:hypothetical protein
VEFTHHARNRLRQNRWFPGDAIAIVLDPVKVDADECCNPRYLGCIRDEGRVANIGLLYPSDHLHLLEAVAHRYTLDADCLVATAKAALAAPDRSVTISDRLAA